MAKNIKMIAKLLGMVFMTGACTYASAEWIRQIMELTDGE